jgi:hypothetical protein
MGVKKNRKISFIYLFWFWDFLLPGAGRKWANSYYYHLFGLLLPLLLFFVDLFIWRRWTADEQSGSSLFWLSFFLLQSWVDAALRFPFDSGRHGDDEETTSLRTTPPPKNLISLQMWQWNKADCFLFIHAKQGGREKFIWIALRHKSQLLLCLDLSKIR